jgi:hypothetical protein
MWFLLLAACTPRADPWATTRAACAVDVHDWASLGVNGGSDGAPVAVVPDPGFDEACATAILVDFGGDPVALLAATGNGLAGDTLTGHLAADLADPDQATGLSMVLLGGWWLLGDNAGTVGDVEANEWVDPTFVDTIHAVAETLGADDDTPLAQILYAYATRNISDLVVEDSGNPGLDWFTHVLFLPQSLDTSRPLDLDFGAPLSVATLLLHEARHATFGGRAHVACDDDDTRSCDDDLRGAHGFQEAMFAAYARSGGCDAEWPLAASEENHWIAQINLPWPGPPPCE